MVPVIDNKIAFSRDQVVTSSQAAKNFGEMRRRARTKPLFVSDRNDGIDTVIIGYDEFEAMALELERLREASFYDVAASRVAAADADPGHKPIPLRDVVGQEEYEAIMGVDTETIPDSELFE